MSNLPIVSFESVDLLTPQPGSGSNPKSSGEETFDSYLKEAGNTFEEAESISQEFDGSESADVPAAAPSISSQEDQGPSEENADHLGATDGGENAEKVSEDGQGKPSGEKSTGDESRGQSAGNSTNGKDANLVISGELPFPQFLAADIEELSGHPIGRVLASAKTGVSGLGNENMPVASGHAEGGAPGAQALNRQVELLGGGAQGTTVSTNASGEGVSGPSALGNSGELSLLGTANGGNASSNGGSNQSNPETDFPNILKADSGASVEGDAKGKDAKVGGFLGKAATPNQLNGNSGQVVQDVVDGSNPSQNAGLDLFSGTAQDNDLGNILQTQFSQSAGGETSKSIPEGANPSLLTSVESVGTHNQATNVDMAPLEVKADPTGQITTESRQSEIALRTRVQEQVIEAAVGRLSIAIRDKISQARIRLDPPSLGQVDMQLQVEDGTLSAKLRVQNAWVRDAINSNLDDLRESLQQQGVEVEEFSVDVDSGMGSWASDQGFEGEESAEVLYLESTPLEEEMTPEAMDGDSVLVDVNDDPSKVDLFA